MSFFYSIINITDEPHNTFIRTLCSKILSHPYRQIDSSSLLHLGYHSYSNNEFDNLIQKTFNSKKFINHENSIYIKYQRNTLKTILPVCKRWFQPLKNDLKNFNETRRGEYDEYFPRDNRLINKIGEIQPGFNYLIDFDHVKGCELIFGSDYGIYISITTQSNTSFRNNVRYSEMQEAHQRKQFAEKKYLNSAIRVLKATYTRNRPLEFEDEQDEKIARLIGKDHALLFFNIKQQ
ncbi:14322_t:CDS:2 [Funneliformis mosseae]|uniref:14322_t:CDS:1 n=1 Tax=Funneliformis mosseae TaxID=27381 RepID=A0A9N9E7N0_FUNMO|nr:14322_t:CDS:2 [Funneliformis mosseae]